MLNSVMSRIKNEESYAVFKGHPPTFVDFRVTGIKGFFFTQNAFLLLNISFQKIAMTDLPVFLKRSCSHMISKHRVNSYLKLASLCPTHSNPLMWGLGSKQEQQA